MSSYRIDTGTLEQMLAELEGNKYGASFVSGQWAVMGSIDGAGIKRWRSMDEFKSEANAHNRQVVLGKPQEVPHAE